MNRKSIAMIAGAIGIIFVVLLMLMLLQPQFFGQGGVGLEAQDFYGPIQVFNSSNFHLSRPRGVATGETFNILDDVKITITARVSEPSALVLVGVGGRPWEGESPIITSAYIAEANTNFTIIAYASGSQVYGKELFVGPDPGSRGQLTLVSVVAQYATLEAECGNGLCELGESTVNCPADCPFEEEEEPGKGQDNETGIPANETEEEGESGEEGTTTQQSNEGEDIDQQVEPASIPTVISGGEEGGAFAILPSDDSLIIIVMVAIGISAIVLVSVLILKKKK
jgi:hypothetical protein